MAVVVTKNNGLVPLGPYTGPYESQLVAAGYAQYDNKGETYDAEIPSALANIGVTNRNLVANRSGLTSASLNTANGSSNTQIGDQLTIQVMADTSDISFRLGNFAASAVAATDLSGTSTITWRGGIFDGTSYYPIFGPSGSRNIVIEPGAVVDTVPVPVSLKKGQSIELITLKTWATAPAFFPGSPVPAGSARDLSEQGTALTDRTLTSGFTAGARVANYAILPPLAILGSGARRPCVAIMGDSIGSQGVSDVTTGRGEYGYMQRGLAAAGIPSITMGQQNLKLSQVVANPRVLGQYLGSCLRIGVTHIALALATNDFADGRTAAQIYADYLKIRDFATPLGIKVVVYTAPPKTNAANNAQNGSETTAWAQRRLLNDQIRNSNGVGNGYFDLAAVFQDPNNIDIWRTDIFGVSSFTINAGGSGYLQNDLIELTNGAVLTANTVVGGAVTAAALKFSALGGFLLAPSNPVLAQNTQNFDLTTFPVAPGTGFSINVTGTVAATTTTDGVHPSIAPSALAMQAHRDAAPTLYQ